MILYNIFTGIGGIFKLRSDYMLDRQVAKELISKGYSMTLQRMYTLTCSTDNPIISPTMQLDYFSRMLGYDILQLKNKV